MTGRRRVRRAARRGFTLIELVSTIAVLAALATVGSGIIFAATDGYVQAATSAQLHTELSIALDRIVRELRSVPLDDEAGGVAPDIDSLTDESIDWDGDNRLALSGSDLLLTIEGGGAAVLLADVTALSLQAYDEDNDAMSQPLSGAACDDVRRVSVTITVQRYGVSEILRSRVFLRSTMQGAGG
ncbi:MAG: prepilin-type N-terminal cleavage/methylation domain-containing protein [Planctomycetota bacterium]|nr:prepilin-type N-terminal cleavage/methylation domain-containing protein [Planctomycetota bacterium]